MPGLPGIMHVLQAHPQLPETCRGVARDALVSQGEMPCRSLHALYEDEQLPGFLIQFLGGAVQRLGEHEATVITATASPFSTLRSELEKHQCAGHIPTESTSAEVQPCLKGNVSGKKLERRSSEEEEEVPAVPFSCS